MVFSSLVFIYLKVWVDLVISRDGARRPLSLNPGGPGWSELAFRHLGTQAQGVHPPPSLVLRVPSDAQEAWGAAWERGACPHQVQTHTGVCGSVDGGRGRGWPERHSRVCPEGKESGAA